ncbi:MAG: SIR2 family protein, partial [Caldilineaceae bacterium]
MQPLIAELADLIIKDNAILFVGSQLGADSEHPPVVERIADALAARIDYKRADRSLPAVARDYEVLQGRAALILALREELARQQSGPDSIHQLIADAVLPTTKLITTRFDQVLENALTQFHKPYVLIVRDTDVPFFDESKVTVIKIQGDIAQPDSLVLTEDDVDAFISNLPTLSDIVRAYFATKTLIFLGYDLSSSHFKRFFHQVTRNLSVYRRTAYAIVREPNEEMDEIGQRYWKNQNVEILFHNPLTFLEGIAQIVKTARTAASAQNPRPAATPRLPLPPHPYKGLQPYSAADAPIFAGRGQESIQLANRVLANRLTVLYGESGVGKSSLLHAGLGIRMTAAQGLLAVAIPEPNRPLAENLHTSLLAAARGTGLQPKSGGDLSDDLSSLVRAVQRELDGPVVLAVDQAEQFFLVYTDEEQRAALEQLKQFLADRSLDLRFVISIREDALGDLQPLEAILPDVLNVRYRVERLRQESARDAIENPAALYGINWEPALVQRLLNDLTDPESNAIGPAQLQINCERLYRETITRDPDPPQTITLALFESLGNTTSLLGDYLSQALQTLDPAQQPPARGLLGTLVSSSGAKLRLTLDELARAGEMPPGETLSILDALVEQSLVRRISRPGFGGREGDGPLRDEFELSHDSLIPRVVSWLGDDFWASQKAREILRQAAPEWAKRARLLPADDLRLASRRKSQLRLTGVEAALLYASAVTYATPVDDWQDVLSSEEQRATLLGLLDHPDEQARAQAARQLVHFPDAETSERLGQQARGDPNGAVRSAAVTALAGQL